MQVLFFCKRQSYSHYNYKFLFFLDVGIFNIIKNSDIIINASIKCKGNGSNLVAN